MNRSDFNDASLKRPGWQERLCERHSDWLERPLPSFAVGDGWAATVATLFDRIGELMRDELPGVRLTIHDVKEKYASLRVSWMGPVDEASDSRIEMLILEAERRSERTCDVCGERGVMTSTRPREGWMAIRCDEHASGFDFRFDRDRK